MDKKKYDGLKLVFIPVSGESILTASGYCEPISVQYYVESVFSSECDTNTDQGLGEGYSFNLMQEPDPNW